MTILEISPLVLILFSGMFVAGGDNTRTRLVGLVGFCIGFAELLAEVLK